MAKVKITVTLHMSEIIYDVQNKTYLTGRARSNGDNYVQVAHMQANDDDENLNQVMRSVGNAIAAMKMKLADYVCDHETRADNVLTSAMEDYDVTLDMPSNFNVATIDTIAAAMHQYVVSFAVGEWFTIMSKDDAEPYLALSAANLDQLRNALNKRMRPKRVGSPSYINRKERHCCL